MRIKKMKRHQLLRLGLSSAFFFVFLLNTTTLFSQTTPQKSIKESIQGTWKMQDPAGDYEERFEGDQFYLLEKGVVIFQSTYEIKGNKIDTHSGKEKLIFKIKSTTDTSLIMKANNEEYHNYVKVK